MIYKDERGEIIDVGEGDFKAVQVITSKKGTVRSNHYHKKGGHLLYVLEGKMSYLEMDVSDPAKVERRDFIVNKGETVFTGPMKAHRTEFLEDTILVCASTLSRADGAYDEDLVRVSWGDA